MDVIPLGAGQDVGRSCIIVTIHDKTIMFDCGMHIGYTDSRKFPDFSYISRTGNFDDILDCIIISHFHLDHCGALPYFTEVLGYSGPIYMTHPTKAILPILLEDYKKILEMKSVDSQMFTTQHIADCLEKVIPLNMNESFEHEDDFIITPYYAGHVIGAAMFCVEYKGKSVVYTGDFSTTADKHLGPARIECIKPDLLITESTYGNVVRDCRKSKERQFLQAIQECIDRGGKMLIPIFALGRFQEICLLLDSYVERMGIAVPIYLSGGLSEKANDIYKRFINYNNQYIQDQIEQKNVFEFSRIKPYHKGVPGSEGPCIIFASPAMLHSGNSLKIFKLLCEDEKNAVIIPGYCVRGTLGEKVLSGVKRTNVLGVDMNINLQVHNIAFSAHADSFGIMKIIDQCKPKSVMLVHGDKQRMVALKKQIVSAFKIDVFFPPNGVMLNIPCKEEIDVYIKKEQLNKIIDPCVITQDIEVVLTLKRDDDGTVRAVDCIPIVETQNK